MTDTLPQLQGLGAALAAAQGRKGPPVLTWRPPYCGDIGMAIRADGTWMYQGSAITRLPLVKLFASILLREADGRHYLVTPAEKVDVTVADAAFLAVELEVQAKGQGTQQRLILRTNVDDVVVAGPEHALSFKPDAVSGAPKPYVHVRYGLEALATRAVYYDLIELLEPGSNDSQGLWSGGVFFAVPPACA